MHQDFTTGSITGRLLRFAFPMMAGNLLQQLYNVADTLIVGKVLGKNALAAVGSSYTLMVFLTSILLGLCMGSGAAFSMQFGRKDPERLRRSIFLSFCLIAAVTVVLNIAAFSGLDLILKALQVPEEVQPQMRDYLWVIFWGISATFLYNYFATLLRSVGNSLIPLLFLGASALLNVGLDLAFVMGFSWGVRGAAFATVLSQFVSGIGITIYTICGFPELRVKRSHMKWDRGILREISGLSILTCVQQSVMNLGILMVQGLVNSFGATVMAAFAAAVKIDSFAYMPVQDFGNAFSTFVAQNHGAGKHDRIRAGVKSAILTSCIFCVIISTIVFLCAAPLMRLFVKPWETEIIAVGVGYLRIEGTFYCGIGILFLLYGYYRAVNRPAMSVVLTVASLGTRVLLAYVLSAIPALGFIGIWMSVPIGWFLADLLGLVYYRKSDIGRGANLPKSAKKERV